MYNFKGENKVKWKWSSKGRIKQKQTMNINCYFQYCNYCELLSFEEVGA